MTGPARGTFTVRLVVTGGVVLTGDRLTINYHDHCLDIEDNVIDSLKSVFPQETVSQSGTTLSLN